MDEHSILAVSFLGFFYKTCLVHYRISGLLFSINILLHRFVKRSFLYLTLFFPPQTKILTAHQIDDPYWEAVNLHYWQTGNLEWYDPSAITTANGSLNIKLTSEPRNGQNYTGGMMTSWNKFCFTGGRIEVAVILPGGTSATYVMVLFVHIEY